MWAQQVWVQEGAGTGRTTMAFRGRGGPGVGAYGRRVSTRAERSQGRGNGATVPAVSVVGVEDPVHLDEELIDFNEGHVDVAALVACLLDRASRGGQKVFQLVHVNGVVEGLLAVAVVGASAFELVSPVGGPILVAAMSSPGDGCGAVDACPRGGGRDVLHEGLPTGPRP